MADLPYCPDVADRDAQHFDAPQRPLVWMGDSLETVRSFSDAVRQAVGLALYAAQHGGKAANAKPFAELGEPGAGVMKIVADDEAGTYRVAYAVKLKKGLYVLHAFQKKSKQGIATPKTEIEMVRRRLREAKLRDAEPVVERS